jgi:hypothetical protein
MIMKKLIVSIMILTALVTLSACGGAADTLNPNVSSSAAPEADIAGIWCVSQVLAPDGTPATTEEMQSMGAGFTLELLQGGTYFVYDANGKALGQGQYSVSGGRLTCTVGETELVYTIESAGTLKSRASDGSVTILARSPEQFTPGGGDDGSDVVDEDSPDGEDADAPDDGTVVSDSPDTEPETDADAPDDGGVVEDDQDSPVTETDAAN